jgi:hypothetical protein
MTVRLWPPHWTVTLLAPLVGDEGTLLASAVSICRTRPNGVQRRPMVRGKPRLRSGESLCGTHAVALLRRKEARLQ